MASNKKVRVAIDWTLDLLFAKDFVQFLTVRAPVQSTPAAGSNHDHLEYSTAASGDGR